VIRCAITHPASSTLEHHPSHPAIAATSPGGIHF
jgi:hypothetical protein